MDEVLNYGLSSFTQMMKLVLEKNMIKGNTWITCDSSHLRNKLKEEVHEYFTASSDIHRMYELIDIANICLFLFIRHTLSSTEARFKDFIKEK